MIKQYLYIMVALLLGIITAHAQEQPNLRDRADARYNKYEYANAATLYMKLAEARNPRLYDLERLAACYQMMNDYEAAENWFARVVQHPDSDPENLLRYGAVLKANGKYREAKAQLEAYASATGNRERVAVELAGCDSAMVWMADPTLHQLRNEHGVNTARSEFSVSPQGETVYYTGEPEALAGQGAYGWTGNAFLRVYTARRGGDNGLSAGLLAGDSINGGVYHTGPVAVADAGQTLYVTRTYPGRDGQRTKEDGQRFSTNKLELYIYQQRDGQWEITPFLHNNKDAYSVGHAAPSPDGNTIYFVSDMPGGQGGTDIWYCQRQADDTWGPYTHAGPTINTPGNELFPSIGADGTLYYSSDGLPGMGDLDIFQSNGAMVDWSKPVNLRYPINSPGDDFAYIANTETDGIAGYLSSNRKGGVGSDDIYSFTWEQPVTILMLAGTTSDKSTGERLPAAVTLYDGAREIVAQQYSDETGLFTFALEPEQSYTVLGRREGYHADSAAVSTAGIRQSDTLRVALLLEPISEVGKTFELENIYYDFDRHEIRSDAAAVLDELVRTMRDNPTLRIELASHTDSRGSDTYNMALSQRRAQSAVDYLASRGIARDRMVAQGYGESRLANHCDDGIPCSSADHQANRRTVIAILAY
ncbi:OmpA family protein [Parapedobacter sp. DT-150]|uniref:OmpA family protein n=1 Tax=Parapedobacter sp. DT-150 TaxID=3396162 RepID=UPI003F1A5478